MTDLREQAEKELEHGICGVIAAFGLAECREWKFDATVREDAERLIRELMSLFHRSNIEENARVVALKAATEAASNDRQFQVFLAHAQKRPRRQRSGKA